MKKKLNNVLRQRRRCLNAFMLKRGVGEGEKVFWANDTGGIMSSRVTENTLLQTISSARNENSVLVYSLSCHLKNVCRSFLHETLQEKFWITCWSAFLFSYSIMSGNWSFQASKGHKRVVKVLGSHTVALWGTEQNLSRLLIDNLPLQWTTSRQDRIIERVKANESFRPGSCSQTHCKPK